MFEAYFYIFASLSESFLFVLLAMVLEMKILEGFEQYYIIISRVVKPHVTNQLDGLQHFKGM